mmetsp:Transcript_21512/g.64387  ORF Transcript_21512/g.64387 Transcript_21512/m.64387 type:complete len:91 (-) Transcript_21512:77-349(-)
MDRRRVACVLLAASPGTRETSCGRRATSPGETRESETDSQERSGVVSTCEGATALLGRPTRYVSEGRRAVQDFCKITLENDLCSLTVSVL